MRACPQAQRPTPGTRDPPPRRPIRRGATEEIPDPMAAKSSKNPADPDRAVRPHLPRPNEAAATSPNPPTANYPTAVEVDIPASRLNMVPVNTEVAAVMAAVP